MHENTGRVLKCMKIQKGEDFYEDCATFMMHDNMSNNARPLRRLRRL